MDEESKDSVHADAVRKTMEAHYAQLLAIREGYYQTLCTSLKEVEGGGQAQAASGEKSEADELRAENKKLNYRITHLLKTIDEKEAAQEGAQGAAKGGA